MRRYAGYATQSPVSQAFRCDGFVRAGQLPALRGAPLPLAELPPFVRALLVTDGTVTKILEAYFWEPVAVETLDQHFETAGYPVSWIQIQPGDRCLVRDARLRGTDSGRIFAEAGSLIRVEHIPEVFRQRLIDREIGIGTLIRDSGLESYREVLNLGFDPELDAVFRTYRIIIGHLPVILITESFPLVLYRI